MADAFLGLFRRRRFGMKPGLDVERALLARFGNPEREYGIVHVAGTNGKGSVCAVVGSVLQQLGCRVGVYTSPHLIRFNERFCVNGDKIGDTALARLAEEIEEIAAAVAGEYGQEPTFFECATAMALEHFRRTRVQVAILETGMGGRLDATNVVQPLLSVITRIDLEHTMHLGPDIESIAFEKCGIIKRGTPVVCGEMDERARGVVVKTAAERNAPLVKAGRNVSIAVAGRDFGGQKVSVETGNASYGSLRLPLQGHHQVENLGTAVTAVETLCDILGLSLESAHLKKGVETVSWPGRFQVLRDNPPVIVDGAHNPGAARALAGALGGVLKGRPLALVAGFCDDKDVRGFLLPFARTVRKLWIVPLSDQRSMAGDKIAAAAAEMSWEVAATSLADALDQSVAWAREAGGAVCITGSLFLAGEAITILEPGLMEHG